MAKMTPEMYTSESQNWMTPPDLVRDILTVSNREKFDIDVCCTEENIPALKYFKGHETDALKESWNIPCVSLTPLVFMNPPYEDLKPFLKKACEEARKGVRIWAVVPARTETIYQQDFGIAAADFTVFLKGRVNFIPDAPTREKLIEKWIKNNREKYPLLTDEHVRPFAEKAVDDGQAPFPTILLYWGGDSAGVMNNWSLNPPRPGTIMYPVCKDGELL